MRRDRRHLRLALPHKRGIEPLTPTVGRRQQLAIPSGFQQLVSPELWGRPEGRFRRPSLDSLGACGSTRGLLPAPSARPFGRERTIRRGRLSPDRSCSRPADTTHPHIVPSRQKRARACARCDGTRLPIAGLSDTDDILTVTRGPSPTDGERLDFRGSRQRFGPLDRRRHRHWLLHERLPPQHRLV